MAEPSTPDRAPPWRAASLLALGVCAVLALGWTWAGWRDLSLLHLPDPDDAMRLVQVRDWLGGQSWSDLSQHRLGPSGVAMHWSRLGDLGISAILLLLRPLIGSHAAEVATVILWPTLLFLCFLLLSARIARRIGGPADAPVAVIVAALAWPATWVFMPGRIDHHGLQIVLLLIVVDALVRRPSRTAGMWLGAAAAAGLTLGVEAAPTLAVAFAGLLCLWLVDPAAERPRVLAAAGALLAATALAALAHPQIWPPELCDAFTPQSASGMAIGAAALLGIGAIPPRLRPLPRFASVAAIGGAALLALWAAAPACLADPYAAVPPELRTLWLDHVEEAQGVLTADAATIISYLGLPIAGMIASLGFARATRDRRWWIMAGMQGCALLVAFAQLRGAHVAAALAVPALAHLVGRARRAGAARRIGGWLASLGLVYALAGRAVAHEGTPPPAQLCEPTSAIDALQNLPQGLVLAPIDLGPRILAQTGQRVLAAPYHRNIAGNLLAFRFFAAPPEHARGLAQGAGVSYIVWCEGALGAAGADLPQDALARTLDADRVPAWLVRLGHGLYRVVPAAD